MPHNEKRKTGIRRRLAGPDVTWDDERLVPRCLAGDEHAWSALIAKYKHLICSIPMKYGATPEDSADVFQSVCLELFSELPRLRKPGALRGWLITVTAHKAYRWKREHARRAEEGLTDQHGRLLGVDPAPDLIEQVEREQMMREAVARLPPRCQEMIKLLFYRHPTLPYHEVARRLGLASGSISIIRSRCLKRLQRALETLRP